MLKQIPFSPYRVVDDGAYDVFQAALLARSLSRACIIFNTQPNSHHELHWMAIVSGNSKAHIFDSSTFFLN